MCLSAHCASRSSRSSSWALSSGEEQHGSRWPCLGTERLPYPPQPSLLPGQRRGGRLETPASAPQQPSPRGAPWAAGMDTRTCSWLFSPCYSEVPSLVPAEPLGLLGVRAQWIPCPGQVEVPAEYRQCPWSATPSPGAAPAAPSPASFAVPEGRAGVRDVGPRGPLDSSTRGRVGGTGGRAFRGSPT